MYNADRVIPYDQNMTSILILLMGLYCKKNYECSIFSSEGFLRKPLIGSCCDRAAAQKQPSLAQLTTGSAAATQARAGLATAVGAAIVLPFRLVPSFLPTPIQLLTWFLDSKSFEHRLLQLRHWMAADGGGGGRGGGSVAAPPVGWSFRGQLVSELAVVVACSFCILFTTFEIEL